ncbi:MAG: LpqB family beta-propeller domain-containing protein [Gemmatimonadales bacterium]
MKPIPICRGRARRGLLPWMFPYLQAGVALAALAPGASAQAQKISEVQVTPETMTLGVGQKQPLFATAFDARGNLIASARFIFWSSDTMIAQVRKDGMVVGVNPGLAKIEARSQGRRASMAILITGTAPGDTAQARAASASVLTLIPASADLFPGENLRIAPQAVREDGSPAIVGRVTWRSLRPAVVSVDTGGVVAGVAPGRGTVEASVGSKLVATLPVEVSQPEFVLSEPSIVLGPGEGDTLRVLVPSQGNREIRGLVQWRSVDSSVASVSGAGMVRANSPGKTEIIASGFSQERRASVVVHREADALVVSPQHSAGPIHVPLRYSRQFTAVAEAADSTPIPEAKIAWDLADTAIAAFDPASGVLTSKALGTTRLTARLADIPPAVWTIRVIPGDIELEPDRVGLAAGQRAILAAAMQDEQGAPAGRAPGLQWSSDSPDVALAREGGVIDGLSPGHALVTATSPWGKSAKADVFVVGDLLVSSNRGGSFGIYQMRATGSRTLHPVLGDSGTNMHAVLAPDRTRIVFSSNRSGNFDIYVMDADGRNLRRLTTDPRNETEPVWTPDGSRIVYTSTRGTGTQIAMMSLDGSGEVHLTSTPGGNHSPAISPDGGTIAFVSGRDRNQDLYAMSLDGGNQRRLTKTSVRESSPSFFPDGDLAFVAERGGRSKGSKVVRLEWGRRKTSTLLETNDPIPSLAVSRDGNRVAYIVGRIVDAAKGRVDFSLFLQSTAPGSRPIAVPLQPGEQILTPSF